MANLLRSYEALLAADKLQDDAAQREVAGALAGLQRELAARARWWSFGRARAQSLYIYGAVGGGKSMLMDLFYANAPTAKKARVHFHGFMQDLHQRLFALRREARVAGGAGAAPLERLAAELKQEMELICFDEFHVTNVADASLLERLFVALLRAGIVFVLTTNEAPDELYRGGLQRARFLPFIALVKERFRLCRLQAQQDYRADASQPRTNWFVVGDNDARAALEARAEALCAPHEPQPETLHLEDGRALPLVASAPGFARLDFATLCGAPRGAADYLFLARRVHTLALTDIPRLSVARLEEALRFGALIDVLYDHRVRLVGASLCSLEKVWQDNEPAPTQAYAKARARTGSRLKEMSRPDWPPPVARQESPIAPAKNIG